MVAARPVLPAGYTSRPATLADVPGIARVVNAAAVEMGGKPDCPDEELRNVLQAPGLDLGLDTRVALAPDGTIAAYADACALSDPPVHPFLWGRVHPAHRNRGLGTSLLGWALSRAREAVARVPDGVRAAAEAMALSTWAPSRELLEAAGFRPFRHSLEMEIDLTGETAPPAWPEGVTVRRMDHPEEDRVVHDIVEEAFRDHFGHFTEEDPEASFARFHHFQIAAPDFDPTLWFVAERGAERIGVALLSEHPPSGEDAGWVGTLAVLRPHRRRGLGRALLLHSFRVLRQRGRTRAQLTVDAENLSGAVRLYEGAGMAVRRRRDRYERELRPGRELGRGR